MWYTPGRFRGTGRIKGAQRVDKVLFIVQGLLAVVLTVAILLQAKGQGFSGSFGGSDSIYRTRRGVEKTLFQFTIGLSIAFMVIAVVSAAYVNQ